MAGSPIRPFYQRLAASSADAKARRRATYSLADCYAALYKFDEALKVLHEVKEPDEQSYVQKKVAEIEQRKHDGSHVPVIRKRG